MIESVSGVSEAPSPSSIPQPSQMQAAAATTVHQTDAIEQLMMTYAGTKEAATRHSNETAVVPGKTSIVHARSLDAVDNVVVRNLLDSLSPDSRVAGSFYLSNDEDPAPKSLIATYYEDV